MTLVNVFTVDPDRQQELIDVLADAGAVMATLDGFISANLHRSLDGHRVVNYVQWRSEEHFERMLQDPVATPHMRQTAEIAAFDPIRTVVVHTDHAIDDGTP